MKHAADKKTADLLPHHDLAGERPAAPKPSERVQAWRAKKGVKAVTLNLPADLVAALDAKAAKQGKTRTELLEPLIRTQLLRKR